jgi:hypothetical protein
VVWQSLVLQCAVLTAVGSVADWLAVSDVEGCNMYA